MKFSEKIWQECFPIYNSIINHSFNLELAAGNLDPIRFSYYIEQDSLYLHDFARSLAIIAARVNRSKMVIEFLDFAKGAFITEQEIVHQYFRNVMPTTPSGQISTACLGYTSYLLSTATIALLEVGIASLLPCFWIYNEVGKDIHQKSVIDNKYSVWVNNYVSEDFSRGVLRMIEITDYFYAAANHETKLAMSNAFATSSMWEFYFWDDAYSLNYFRKI